MFKNLIKISFVYLLLFAIAAYLFLIKLAPVYKPTLAFFFVLGLIAWIYLVFRFFSFRRKLSSLFRLIISGNYETGIKLSRFFGDEIKSLGQLINKAANQLAIYDQQRGEKVFLNFRALEVIYRTVKEGIILADLENEIFRFNPVAQSIFDMKQERLTFEAINKEEGNSQFMELFINSTQVNKVPLEGTVLLRLPMRNLQKELFVKIIPVKDKNEKVQCALIFINLA